MGPAAYRIEVAVGPDDLAAVAGLFRAYAASLGVDLAYQGFEAEVANLPGRYAPPAGRLLLARSAQGEPLGCIALRALETPRCCEMKRLYVAPAARGLGLGEALVRALIAEARAAGYSEMRLDTLPEMRSAQALYARLGFKAIEPYYATPVAGTAFLALDL